MDNGQILETAKAKKAKGMDLNAKETELYNNYLNIMQAHPNTYKNDAYGLLSELYDNLKNFDAEQTDKENQTSIYFKIVNTINDVILFAKTKELKPEKVNKVIKKAKFLNQIKVSLTKINEADINDIESTFDFDLDGNDTAQKFIEHAELIETKILKEIEAAEPRKVANVSSEVNHPNYNPNEFNKNGYNLFKYLYENYYLEQKTTNTKLINIWHYFNNELNDKTDYKLRLTKNEYLKFIIDNYKIKVTNVDKTQAYENKHLPKIKDHFEAFKTLNN